MNNLLAETIFRIIVVLIGALACASGAIFYFRRVRMVRPVIGVFNFRDIGIMFIFIILLPVLYLVIPEVLLTGFLVLTFTGILYITLRPLLSTRFTWLIILSLLIANIVVAEHFLGTNIGWQMYLAINSILVLLAAVGASNLYVQGGMRLRHIAWFALLLAVYDVFFAFVIPLTLRLADRFQTQPLSPFFGFSLGVYNGNIGLGDLLTYGLYTVAAYKGFGKRGMMVSFVIITVFGALVPGLFPLIITIITHTNAVNSIIVPTQGIFGPAAFFAYLWLARRTPERSMGQWLDSQTAGATQPSVDLQSTGPAIAK